MTYLKIILAVLITVAVLGIAFNDLLYLLGSPR